MDYSDYDLDSFANMDPGGMDFGGIENMDFGNMDLGGMDLGGLENLDLSGLENLDFGNMDLGGMDLGALENLDLAGLQNLDFGNMDLGGIDLSGENVATGPIPFGESSPDYKQPSAGERAAELERYNNYLANQEAGRDTTGGLSSSEFIPPDSGGSATTSGGTNDGKMPSGWQKSSDGSYVNIRDDGTANGIDQDGNPFTLSTAQVGARIKSGDLNTFASGYNTVTGGNKVAPGGGSSVVLKNGKEGQLMTNGNVIDKDTGKTIGTQKDVKTVVTQDGDGNKITKSPEKITGTGTTTGAKTGTTTGAKAGENSLNSLLPLLLALLAMNKSGGGGGGQSTVIPGLTATQKQTPYAQQQSAPGYRPGQGGIRYFDQTQYTPKMAAGGIARLLQGPGDGVSDSIPAVITDGMSSGGQPAKVARGEYIMDARTVAALGNGSTDAGAERLDKMRQNILRDDRRAGVGKDSKAYRHLMA
jgi:hypothetical protein